MEVLIAFCTFPDAEVARKIVREIVDFRLVACGNIIPKIHSIYRWQGKVESADEALAIFKLDAACYAKFETTLRSLQDRQRAAGIFTLGDRKLRYLTAERRRLANPKIVTPIALAMTVTPIIFAAKISRFDTSMIG